MKSKRREKKAEVVKNKLGDAPKRREYFKKLLQDCTLGIKGQVVASSEQKLEVLVEAICKKVGDESEEFKNYLYFLIETDPALQQSLLKSLH